MLLRSVTTSTASVLFPFLNTITLTFLLSNKALKKETITVSQIKHSKSKYTLHYSREKYLIIISILYLIYQKSGKSTDIFNNTQGGKLQTESFQSTQYLSILLCHHQEFHNLYIIRNSTLKKIISFDACVFGYSTLVSCARKISHTSSFLTGKF